MLKSKGELGGSTGADAPSPARFTGGFEVDGTGFRSICARMGGERSLLRDTSERGVSGDNAESIAH